MPMVSLPAPNVSLRYSGSKGTIKVKENFTRKFPIHAFIKLLFHNFSDVILVFYQPTNFQKLTRIIL